MQPKTISQLSALLYPFLFLLISSVTFSQVSVNTAGTAYTQNFDGITTNATNGSTVPLTANTTIPGWYSSETTLRTQLTASVRNNTGDMYAVVAGADKSIGTRPSGGTGDIYFGVRLRNNTGSVITAVEITYAGEQWSIAENGTNVNSLDVSYRIAATVTSSTTGTWTAIPALAFTQIYGSAQSSGLGGTACTGSSNQCLSLNGNLAANRKLLTTCLSVNIPAGQEIFIRWGDEDNAQNDHHFQVDDVSITLHTVTCSVALPVTWVEINADTDDNMIAQIEWSVASEHNNDYFEVLMASDEHPVFEPVAKVNSEGDTDQLRSYSVSTILKRPGTYYYRIRQKDRNGRQSYSETKSLTVKSDKLYLYRIPGKSEVRFSRDLKTGTSVILYDISGREVFSVVAEEPVSVFDFGELNSFTGYLLVRDYSGTTSFMVVF